MRGHRRQPRDRPRGRAADSAPRAPACSSSRAPRMPWRGGRRVRVGREAPPQAWRSTSPPRRRRAHRGRGRGALRSTRRPRQQRRAPPTRRSPRRGSRGRLAGGLGAERDGAARRCGPRSPAWPIAAGDASSTSAPPPPSGLRGLTPEYSVTKAAELSLSRVFADALRRARASSSTPSAPAPRSRSCGWSPAACWTSPPNSRASGREEALAVGRRRPPDRRASPRSREIADAIVFLCSERASYVAGAAWSVDGGTVQVII